VLLQRRRDALPGEILQRGGHAGVDATPKVVERGRQRCQAAGLDKKISFTLADVCASGLPSGSADFIWGEDAWVLCGG